MIILIRIKLNEIWLQPHSKKVKSKKISI